MTTYSAVASGSTPGLASSTSTGTDACFFYTTGTGYALHTKTSTAYGTCLFVETVNDTETFGIIALAGADSSAQGCTAIIGRAQGPSTMGNTAIDAQGLLVKSSGTFLIDHPSDPENKYLAHSFVESPEMKNIYDGIATSDASGECVVELPAYFDALNDKIRYLLTPIGSPAPSLHIKQTYRDGKFSFAGASPNQEVCWQVSGVRRDAYALANPIEVEREKSGSEKGFYRHPEVHGQPASKGILFQRLAANLSSAT